MTFTLFITAGSAKAAANPVVPSPVVSSNTVSKPINWRKPSENKPYPVWSKLKNPWIYVSLKKQNVYIYGNGKVQYTMICSTGAKNTPTPKGTYHIQAQRGTYFYSPLEREGGRYWVSWLDHGVYLFHTVPINAKGQYIKSVAEELGKPASHGCVHLTVADSYWMYKTVPYGLKVVIR